MSKSYPGSDREILSEIDFELAGGERCAIVGPSGSGKSTLLNIIGMLDEADAGDIELFGRSVVGLSANDRAMLRAKDIGFIFQLHHLMPQSTVWENVLVPRLAKGIGGVDDESEKRAESLLNRVGMEGHRSKFPSQLSGGERQRVAVVRALINQPRLILADEPTGSLDGKSASALIDLLLELNEESKTALILVSHDLDNAKRIGRMVRLDEGKLNEIAAA